MSQIARPAYWLYYQFGVRAAGYEGGLDWFRKRVALAWSELVPEARQLLALERERTLELLHSAGIAT